MAHNLFNTLQDFDDGSGHDAKFYSLPHLKREGIAQVSRLPFSLRVVLESVMRNYDGMKIDAQDVQTLADWSLKRNAPLRSRSQSHACCCKTLPAYGCW